MTYLEKIGDELLHPFAARICFRAANLCHCKDPISEALKARGRAWSRDACVKRKAVRSLQVVVGMSAEEAEKQVEKVYAKCSKDLEPVGRVVRGHADGCRAFSDFEMLRRGLKES